MKHMIVGVALHDVSMKVYLLPVLTGVIAVWGEGLNHNGLDNQLGHIPGEVQLLGFSMIMMIWNHEKDVRTCSGIATGVARGAECHPWQRKFCQKSGKRGKNQEKMKNREKRGQIGEKRQESGSFFHFAPPDRWGWLRYWEHDIYNLL